MTPGERPPMRAWFLFEEVSRGVDEPKLCCGSLRQIYQVLYNDTAFQQNHFVYHAEEQTVQI